MTFFFCICLFVGDQGDREDHETRLSRNAFAQGYRIREVNIFNDGNCLFHAVKDQLDVLGVPGHTHKSLRNLAVQELQSNMVNNHVCSYIALSYFNHFKPAGH